MADPPSHPDSYSDDGDDGAPRWVRALGIITIVLILLFVILHLTGNNLGGHTPSGGIGGRTQ